MQKATKPDGLEASSRNGGDTEAELELYPSRLMIWSTQHTLLSY